MACPTTCQQATSFMQMTQNSSPSHNLYGILQCSLNISASWSKDWELDPNPTKNERLTTGSSSHFVTYTLPSHNSPNTQTIPRIPPPKT